MLTLRDEQRRALGREQQRRYEARVLDHLFELWPEECRALGRSEVAARIHRAVRRARWHGFTTERQALGWIHLVFTFGEDFEKRPEHAWAAAILERSDLSPGSKIARLHHRGDRELERRGPAAET